MKHTIKATHLKQSVLAMMHGDGYVDVNYNSGKARLDIYHCDEQKDYLLWKAFMLKQIKGVKCTVTEKIDARPLKRGGTRVGWRLQTNFSRYFFNLHQTPTKFKLKQLVKPLALVVLWQDDGTLMIDKYGHYSSATLCTDSWEEGFLKGFIKYFNIEYGWVPELMNYTCRGKQYPRLRMRKKEMLKFSELVKSQTQDSMQYKLL